MCGISGYLELDRGVDTDTLLHDGCAPCYRGPDDEGYALIGKGVAFYRERTRCQAPRSSWDRGGSGTFLDWGTGG
ncbi:MAG: hypothetical protein V8R40_00880 [Dysosmobacter sp.]